MNSPSNQTYDLCVVGAGIAGLNALFVASQYLSGGQRIALVDSRPRVGGMWVDTYPYVRLHQPHPFFTAGNIEWTFGKDPSHLATKAEVLDRAGHPVPGLYAAGRCTSGLPAWGHGYSSGMSLADCTFFGRQAGRTAAQG